MDILLCFEKVGLHFIGNFVVVINNTYNKCKLVIQETLLILLNIEIYRINSIIIIFVHKMYEIKILQYT